MIEFPLKVVKNCHVLKIQGPDAEDFLHRMSTQNVKAQEVGTNTHNLFLNHKGRLLFLVHQQRISTDCFLLISFQHEREENLESYLNKFAFVEDLEITLSKQKCQITALNQENIPLLELLNSTNSQQNKQDSRHLKDFYLLLFNKHYSFYFDEIHSLYHPLEIGLEHAISWNKGCYIGQEVVSRMHNYNKINKQLVFLKKETKQLTENKEGTLLEKAAPLYVQKLKAGEIINLAPCADDNRVSALISKKYLNNKKNTSFSLLATETMANLSLSFVTIS